MLLQWPLNLGSSDISTESPPISTVEYAQNTNHVLVWKYIRSFMKSAACLNRTFYDDRHLFDLHEFPPQATVALSSLPRMTLRLNHCSFIQPLEILQLAGGGKHPKETCDVNVPSPIFASARGATPPRLPRCGPRHPSSLSGGACCSPGPGESAPWQHSGERMVVGNRGKKADKHTDPAWFTAVKEDYCSNLGGWSSIAVHSSSTYSQVPFVLKFHLPFVSQTFWSKRGASATCFLSACSP